MAKAKNKFLKPALSKRENVKNVNVRVDAKLFDDFDKCRKFAAEQGFDLSISDVVRTAMVEAIAEVRRLDAAQGKLKV